MERMTGIETRADELLRDALPEVEVVLAERVSRDRLRVVIDRPGGVDLELCERVSRQLSPLRDRWALEVSSPGIERPLVRPEHFRRVTGQPVAVRTEEPLDGRRSFRGTLLEATDDMIEIDQDGDPVRIPLSAVRRANLVAEVGGTR